MKIKTIYAAMLMSLALAAVSCDPEDVSQTDPSIEVSPAALQLGYESSVQEIKVTANTGWNLFRTDQEGNEINWVKVDRLSGKGSCVMQIKTLDNAPLSEERHAVLRFEAGSATAYLDIVQAANPNEPPVDPEDPDTPEPPDNPDPETGTIALTFDFTCEPQTGWPVTDSYTHVDGGTSCVYKLEGKDYIFVLADCNGASACRVFWKYEDAGKWLALNAKYRYVGLPAIEGYKLSKVAFVHASATSSKRAVGVCKAIEAANVLPDADGAHGYVSGGESMATPDQGTEYVFALSGTEANTVYYFMCTGSGIGVGSFTLTYEAVE